ncbi:MAG: Zn-dependent alcohol dehydrogenase [Chloroflexi bacterium]|nr:MAG: Zn-dependent alcohol dehydrogenase [Chloroflexota bacterium]
MQALYLANGQLSIRTNHPQPQPASGEALIRIRLAGICSTDLEIVKGYAGFRGVLGHEFVGEVVATADSADKDWVGQRVVGTINIGCRECVECLAHGPEHCPHRTVLGIIGHDGVFAEYITLPVANLLVVPDTVPDEAAVFTEPLAAALRIREQVMVRPSAKTAVVGPGRLGLLIGKVLALAGTEVTMLGRSERSLMLPAQWGLRTGFVTDYPENSFDFVVEATGNEAGFAHSLRLVRPRGTLILKSTFHGQTTLDLTKLVVAEINVVGSRCGPFAPALRLLAEEAVPVRDTIEAEYSLSDALTAFEHAARPGVRKVLIRP